MEEKIKDIEESIASLSIKKQEIQLAINNTEISKEINEIEEKIKELEEERKITFKESGIEEIEQKIAELKAQKQEIQIQLDIVNSKTGEQWEQIATELKNEIKNIDLEIDDIKLDLNTDEAKEKLKELEEAKEKLTKEEAEANINFLYNGKNLKDGIAEINTEIKKLEAEKTIIFKESGIENIETEIDKLADDRKEIEIDIKAKTSELKSDLKEIDTEILSLKKDKAKIEFYINVNKNDVKKQISEIDSQIQALLAEKTDIQFEIKANTTETEKKITQIEREIDALEAEKVIKLETSGITEARQEIETLNKQMEESERQTKELNNSFLALGVTGAAAFAGIVSSIKKGIEAYTQYTNALSGLQSQMEYIGEDMSKAQEMMEELTKDGLMSEADVAASIKNLTLYGLSLEEANEVILRLKDSAAYNREAHYSLSEAVRVTTEGIKNENSVLSDAAGVTKNIAKMKEEYAAAIGKSYDSLTQEEKAQAVYNGVLEETEAVLGNAEKVANELSGTLSKASTQAKKLAQAFGESLEPCITDLAKSLTESLENITEFIKANKSMVAGLTTGATTFALLTVGITAGIKIITKLKNAITSVITAINSAKTATLALEAATAPIIAAISFIASLSVGTWQSYKAKATEAAEEQERINELLEEFTELLESTTDDTNIDIKISNLEELKEAKETLEEYINNYNNYTDLLTKGVSGTGLTNTLIKDLDMTEEEVENLINVLNNLGYAADETFYDFGAKTITALEDINKAIETLEKDTSFFNNTLTFNVNIDEVVTALETIEDLKETYETLASGGSLSNSELVTLANQYEEIADYIAKTGDLSMENGQKILDIVEEEINAQKKLMQVEETRIKNAIAQTNLQIKAQKELLQTLDGDEYEKQTEQIKVLEEQVAAYEEQLKTATTATLLISQEIENFDATAMINEYKRIEDECDTLYSYYETLASGERLTAEEIYNLIDTYPKLDNALKENGDVTFDTGELIIDVINDIRNAYDTKRQTLINSLKTEIQAMESYLESVTNIYNKEKESLIDLAKARMLAYELDLNVTYDNYNVPTMDEQQTAIQKAIEQKLENSKKLIEELEKIGNISKNADASYKSLTDSITESQTTATTATEETTTALEQQLEIYNNLLAVSEISNKKQLEMLEEIRDKYAETAEDYQKIDALIYSQKKTVLNEWYDEEIAAIQALNKGREDNTDFQAIINKYTEFLETLKEIYKDYPETLKTLEDEVNSYIVEATEARIEKIYNLEKEALNSRLEALDGYSELMQKLDGLMIDGVEIDFGYEKQAAIVKEALNQIEEAINEFVSVHGNSIKTMSDTEKEYYEYLLELQTSYQEEYLDLYISYIKEKQEALEESYNDQIEALEEYSEEYIATLKEQYNEEVSLAKEKSQEIIANLKEEYTERIALAKEAYEAEVAAAKEAANEQIAIYEERIAEIEALLTQASRSQTQNDILDQIDRLYEQLKYETSEINKYELEKQIANLQAEYDYNEWKYALEDEKDALQDAISEIKEELSDKLTALKEELEAEVEYLEEQRDYYIALEEEKLEAYLELLEERLNAAIEAEEAATAQKIALLEKELETAKQTYSQQLAANKSMLNSILTATQNMYKKKEQATQNNVDTEIEIIESGTDLLINMLFGYGDTFAQIGYSWIEALTNAFNSGLNDIASSVAGTIEDTANTVTESSANTAAYAAYTETGASTLASKARSTENTNANTNITTTGGETENAKIATYNYSYDITQNIKTTSFTGIGGRRTLKELIRAIKRNKK